MKQHTFTRILFFIFQFTLSGSIIHSQTCLPSGIRLTSQNEIDNFSSSYPGCTTIEGSLTIGDPDTPFDDSDIVNLDGLSQITSIKGDIIIASNDLLTSIEGLANLTKIEAHLVVRSNPDLLSLHGLENIRVIEGSLEVEFNSNLVLTGLENLEIIKGKFEVISGENNILDPLDKIDSIYGDMRFQSTYFNNFLSMNTLRYLGGVLIMSSTGIDNFTGLGNLTQLGGLYLYRNDNISLSGLNNVTIIHGDMDLLENDGVTMGGFGSSLVEIEGNLIASMTNAGINALTALRRIGGYFSYGRNHLASSFSGPPNLEYIGKSLQIDNNNGILSISGWTNLDTVIGYIHISNHRELTSVTAFQNLKVLTGEYRITDNRYLESLDNLPQLEVLGGIVIESNPLLENFPEFPNVEKLNGRVSIKYNDLVETINFPDNVTNMSGDLDIFGNEILKRISGFSNLTSVGGDFLFWINGDIDTVEAFTKLDSIGGEFRLELYHALSEFPGINKFEYIGGDITFGDLDINDLTCLEELDSIPGQLRVSSCDHLTSLRGIQHLTKLGGLSLGALKNLPNLNELQNLTSLGGDLSIANCDSLTSLQGLVNITSIGGRLNISYNDNLTGLVGIQNIDPQSIETEHYFVNDIEIQENPLVSVCNLPNICSALRDYKRTFIIEDNAPGCNDVREIECKDYGLSGNVFYDGNQNKLKDPGESGVPGIKLSLQPDNKITTTDEEGNFLVLADEGEIHMLKIEPWADWFVTTDSSQYTRLFTAGSPSNSNNNFGIFPEVQKNDLSVNISSDATRCNETVTFYVRYQNSGTTKLKGRIKIIFNDDISYSYATIAPFNSQYQSPNIIYHWRIDSLQPFDYVDFKVAFKMPNQSHAGEVYDFQIIALIDSAGTEVIKDAFVYSPVILCSYDPNDKIVTPPGVKDENFTLLEDILTYTVRFQNTGNAHAVDITILDTIDASLDINSLNVVNSSWPVFTTLDGSEVQFFFQNIWLPDSLFNEPESHGFVTYEISSLPGVTDLTPVKNEASIIFDFNDPILTNETLNTLVEEICDDVTFHLDTVICSGENYLGYTETGVYKDTIHIGSTCDSLSQINLQVRELNISDEFFEVCQGAFFIYHGQTYVVNESIVLTDSLYSPEGCVTLVVTAYIEAIIPQTHFIDTFICEGELFDGIGESGIHFYDVFNPFTGCQDHVELHLEVIPIGSTPCLTATDDIGYHDLKVYPNPVRSEMFIESSWIIESVTLFATDGVMVENLTMERLDSKVKLKIGDKLPDGLYLLAIKINGSIYFRKVGVVNQ